MYSKTKRIHIFAQHHSDPTHTFRVDCLGSLPVLYKVNKQQGQSSSQQCTNPLLIISRTLHYLRYCDHTGAEVERPESALMYPVESSSTGFWKM